jgi:hypothetical protein
LTAKSVRLIAQEKRAVVNFELVERLAEREQRDWTYFGRLRREREKKLRDPQDVLIEADRWRNSEQESSANRSSRRIPWGDGADLAEVVPFLT